MKCVKQYRSLIFCVVILTSCGPAAKLRRAEKLIAKAEKQGARWHSDTVFKTIEVMTVRTQFDTVVRNVNFTDTIVVTKNNIITKIKIDTVTRDVFVETESLPDTIRVKVPVAIGNEIKAGHGFWYYMIRGLILAILAFVAGYLLRGRTGKDLTIRFDKKDDPNIT